MNDQKLNIEKSKNEFLKNEFSSELYDETAKVGYAPITGGLKTRALIKKGEQMLQENPEMKNKSKVPL